jgi:hypothetical protein
VRSDTTLSKQLIFSPHFFLGENRRATRWVNWQAGGIPSRLLAMFNAARNTPPQIDEYAYIKRRTSIGAVGIWRRRIPSSPVTHKLLPTFPFQQVLVHFFRDLVAFYCKRGNIAPRLSYWATRDHASRGICTCSTSAFIGRRSIRFKHISPLVYASITNVTWHFPHVNRKIGLDDRSTTQGIVLASPGEFIAEGEQKKGGKQPKPAKTKPAQPKPEREGDKGKRKVKNPRTEELVIALCRKAGSSVLLSVL